jgi:carboxymethylenebutenolidase
MASLDLVALWEAHCRYEFETRDVDATMATMVAEPYVNHIPTMTGGVGHDQLKRFYKYHFIGVNPPDLESGRFRGHQVQDCRLALG